MLKYLGVLITVVFTSLYFFPFNPSFLPEANTKMIMAAFGLVILGINLARGNRAILDRDIFVLSIIAAIISLMSLAAVAYNSTNDYTFVSYVVSMWVWLGGAYVVINLIRGVHGHASIELVAHYLIAVCVAQCVIANAMGLYQPLKDLVDGLLGSEGFMGKAEDRLYGIGASFDVAGMRFAGILSIIAYFILSSEKKIPKLQICFYLVAFVIIAVIGNMIGRSTTIGIGVALLYWVMVMVYNRKEDNENLRNFRLVVIPVLLIFIPVLVFAYKYNEYMHDNLRFAFEGFFSLWEKGSWDVNSNNILKDMIVFPDNMKTWLIGDGYIENPYGKDPYYTGPTFGGYYMATDIGYLRFIFYFGIFGMLTFVFYMWKVAFACINRFPDKRNLFLMILLINYIIWFKVSSELFSLFALFLCVSQEEEEMSRKHLFATA